MRRPFRSDKQNAFLLLRHKKKDSIIIPSTKINKNSQKEVATQAEWVELMSKSGIIGKRRNGSFLVGCPVRIIAV
jgi:hypothetical protein